MSAGRYVIAAWLRHLADRMEAESLYLDELYAELEQFAAQADDRHQLIEYRGILTRPREVTS